VIGARLILPLMLLGLTASFAGAAGLGVFGKKGKSEAQIKRLIETLRTDPDEAKRRAAIADLHDADPRAHPDVISALIASLQKDGSATVRGDAAAAIGHYHHVFPLAGMALEATAEQDASMAVRASAQQALWEYHLAGYRSLRGADGIAGQSKEPPIARPASLQPSVLPVTAVSPAIPQPMPARPVRPLPAPGPSLPPIAAQPPSMARALARAVFAPRRPLLGPLAMLRMLTPPAKVKAVAPLVPLLLTPTPEPPLAKPPVLPIAPAPSPVVYANVAAFGLILPPVSEPPERSNAMIPGESAMGSTLLDRMYRFELLPPGPRVRSLGQ
jgi:hypothetical protein